MLTAQMPALTRALFGSLPPAAVKQLTQALGNCNQEMLHRGPIAVAPDAWQNVTNNNGTYTSFPPSVNQYNQFYNQYVNDIYNQGDIVTNLSISNPYYNNVTNLGDTVIVTGGPPGRDGRDGLDGLIGVDGVNGRDGQAGERGADAPAGPAGTPGAAGQNGRDGRDGFGVPGQAGQDGRDGLPGAPGAPGIGINGRDGRDGVGFNPAALRQKTFVRTVNVTKGGPQKSVSIFYVESLTCENGELTPVYGSADIPIPLGNYVEDLNEIPGIAYGP